MFNKFIQDHFQCFSMKRIFRWHDCKLSTVIFGQK
jgi:hypothetical protein